MANDQTNDQNPTITRTRTPILIAAMRLLSKEIQSEDGVANAAIAEAADRLEELEAGIGDEITRPHDGPENCPTYHDGCNCTVEVLVHNIERAEKAEARIDDLSRAYAVQGLALEDFQTRVKELEALVSTLEVQAVNSIEPGWVMIPAVEWRQAWDRFNH